MSVDRYVMRLDETSRPGCRASNRIFNFMYILGFKIRLSLYIKKWKTIDLD